MQVEENIREFKGVWLPKEIWLDRNLNALEKVIFAEIDSLDNEETGCYASNKYLADFCQCSETKVSTAVSKLIKLGYLYIKSFDGRTRILKSRLSNFERQNLKDCKADIKNLKDINININTNDKNKLNNNIIAEQIITYLNEKAGKHFKPVDSNIKFIKARLKDYTEEDLKAVIDKKVKDWKGTEWQDYLRPETLFNATKFESYLNQSEKFARKDGRKEDMFEQLDRVFGELENE